MGINTSVSEGFGLISFEHASTGAPQVMGRHSAIADLWSEEGGALLVDPTCRWMNPGVDLFCWTSPPEAYAEALDYLYHNPEIRREYGSRARNFALSGRFSRERMSQHERKLLRDALDLGLVTRGSVAVAMYDSPATLPFLRRNEVWIEIV